jgi:hypothetical protein
MAFKSVWGLSRGTTQSSLHELSARDTGHER